MPSSKKYKCCTERARDKDTAVLTKNSKDLIVTLDLSDAKKQTLAVILGKNGNSSGCAFPPKTDEYTVVKHTSM